MSEYKFENCVVTVYDFRNLVIPAGATINIYGSGFKVSATGNDQKQANDASSVTANPTTNNNVQIPVVSTPVDQEYKVDDLKSAIDSQDAKKEFLTAIKNDVANDKIAGNFCFDLDEYSDFSDWLTRENKQPLSDRDKYSIAQFAKDFNISAV
jgi:hypothetical protein